MDSSRDPSQVSAFAEKPHGESAEARQYSAQLMKLRRYIDEMHGMKLDTQA